MAQLYLGGGDPTHPLASPIFGDLRGLPKTLILVGDHEVLLDDSRLFSDKAKQEGVQVQVEVWPEMWHGWIASAPRLPEANEAIQRIGAFVRHVTSEQDYARG
jgi:acetyl esterase/lipase